MLKNVTTALAAAGRAFFSNWRLMAAFVVVYAGLLAALYYFFTTPLARLWQVGLNFVLALVAPALFFLLQAMGVSYAQEGAAAGATLARAARLCLKLVAASVPVLLLALLFGYGLGWVGEKMAGHGGGWPVGAKGTLLSAVWYLLMCFALPLVAVHSWLAASRGGVGQVFKGIGRVIARALAPRSALIYAVGLVVFAVIPYFLIVPRTPAKNPWVDMTLLGVRLALALLLILVGWVVTLGALSRLKADGAQAAAEPARPTQPTAPALNQS
jgi:hypothetical protein